jgi:hypothetical protein
MKYNVAVLGASSNPERYSFKAVQMLAEHAYGIFPVHPSEQVINGIPCYPNLSVIPEPLDTITVYLSAKNSTPLIEDIIASRPRRVILNPGAETAALTDRCHAAGIQVQQACTLVLLRTGQF